MAYNKILVPISNIMRAFKLLLFSKANNNITDNMPHTIAIKENSSDTDVISIPNISSFPIACISRLILSNLSSLITFLIILSFKNGFFIFIIVHTLFIK
ncbi:hypothetical protein CF078_16505 [Clostridium botulinum]|uniref:Uncharacterized protein n=1 Tax=Clostridium sporogenes TaxID=1509 RepID=A0AAE6LYS7_CLOSG|nr:hypothetical protein [Clostridium botulinum]NFR57696.1 hypothetical protein [Clostridium botulinum]QDY34471.1 hypothetical protein CGS26_19340 [Clostridium sporogenes]